MTAPPLSENKLCSLGSVSMAVAICSAGGVRHASYGSTLLLDGTLGKAVGIAADGAMLNIGDTMEIRDEGDDRTEEKRG
jgi:hypothetical protein